MGTRGRGLTYLRVDVEAGDLNYDLAASSTPSTVPSIRDTGLSRISDVVVPGGDTGAAVWPVVAALAAILVHDCGAHHRSEAATAHQHRPVSGPEPATGPG